MINPDREELLAAFLAGTLDGSDRDRFLRELRHDPGWAKGARDHWVTEKLLALELDTRARRAFTEKVSELVGELEERPSAKPPVTDPPETGLAHGAAGSGGE